MERRDVVDYRSLTMSTTLSQFLLITYTIKMKRAKLVKRIGPFEKRYHTKLLDIIRAFYSRFKVRKIIDATFKPL